MFANLLSYKTDFYMIIMPSKKHKTIAEANVGKSTGKRMQHMQELADKRMKAKESSLTTGEAVKHFATVDGPAHSSASLMVSNDSHQENDHRQSTLSKKLYKFWENTEDDHTDSTVWMFLEIGQLNRLLCDIACPECGSSLSVSLETHLGLAREMTLKCSDWECDYKQQQGGKKS